MNECIDEVLNAYPFGDNPYFRTLDDGSFAREDFLETQIQFFFAVTFFARPMAVIAAKIPRDDQRMEIVRNVWEEHGAGNPSLTHSSTFREFLARVGPIAPEDIDRRALWPEVRAFNTALAGAATLDEYIVSVGMMGIIERMFVEISHRLAQTVVSRGWLSPDRMIHYDLHHTLDVKHAEDFFAVLRPAWETDLRNRYYIEQGLQLGAYLFDRLYRDLHAARGRRAFAEQRGPHSRA